MRSLEEILKFINTYNRNIYRIYYYLYLSNNFNYCSIQIITYFRAFEDNIFSGQRILYILKKLLLNKIYSIISNKLQFNLLKYQQKMNLMCLKDLPRIFFSLCHRGHRDRCTHGSGGKAIQTTTALLDYCMTILLHAQTTA